MKNQKKKSRKVNYKIIIYSVIGLIFIGLGFAIDWLFLLGAVLIIWLNQRELIRK
jgi:hypothetical protein